MAMNYQQEYVEMLRSELANRQMLNSAYSLRAFARDLDIGISRLSLAFSGKKGISGEKASQLLSHLPWSCKDKQLFLNLVEAAHARSSSKKKTAIEALERRQKDLLQQRIKSVDADQFSEIADPIHYQVMECLVLDQFEATFDNLSSKLGLPKDKLALVLQRLIKLNRIKKRGNRYHPLDTTSDHDSPQSSVAINRHHIQNLKKAIDAVNTQDVDDRYMSSLTIAISEPLLDQVKEKIRNFRMELNQFITDHPDNNQKEHVYFIGNQLFRITNKNSEGES